MNIEGVLKWELGSPPGDAGPKPLAIVTFGYDADNTSSVYDTLEQFHYARDVVYDLRKRMTDPSDGVTKMQRKGDGAHPWTQRSVFAESSFNDTIIELVADDYGKQGRADRVVFRACKTGYHHADVVGRAEKDVLNRIVRDPDRARDHYAYDNRMFNAQHFPLCHTSGRDIFDIVQLAWHWACHPWAKIPMQEPPYGLEGAITHPKSYRNLSEIYYGFAANCDTRVALVTTNFDRGTVLYTKAKAKSAAAPSVVEPKNEPDRRSRSGTKSQSGRKQRRSSSSSSSSGSSSKHTRRSVKSRSVSIVRNYKSKSVSRVVRSPSRRDDDNRDRPATRLRIRSPPPPPIRSDMKPEQPPHPPWASAHAGIEVWHQSLQHDFGCDEPSIKDLFLLAQLSNNGYQAAINIVSKLYKKISDHQSINNPSGFLHSCVNNARNRLAR